MKIIKLFLNRISKLSTKIFLIMLICVIIPLYIMFMYTKNSFVEYIQQELSNRTIQSISKSQQDIYYTFQDMANISNIFIINKDLKKALLNDKKRKNTFQVLKMHMFIKLHRRSVSVKHAILRV